MSVVIQIKLISVNLPESYLKILEILVAEGKFPNRSEAIRCGIRDLIKTEFLIEKSTNKNYNMNMNESGLKTDIQEKMLI